jgi:hypothetical protein
MHDDSMNVMNNPFGQFNQQLLVRTKNGDHKKINRIMFQENKEATISHVATSITYNKTKEKYHAQR